MSTPPLGDRIRSLLSVVRFGQFASVGVVGAVCDNTVLLLSSELGFAATVASLLGIPGFAPEVAKALGIETAIVVMFLLNDNWTFKAQGVGGLPAMLRRLLRSNLVRAGGILVQLGTFRLLFRVPDIELTIASIDAWFVVAKVGGIGAGMVVNYVAESLFTWRVTAE